MKRTITFTVGVVIFAAASAVGKSDQPSISADATTAQYGQLSLEHLTDQQRAILQKKYRYWSSSGAVAPKAPI